jgi:Cyclophilin-like family
MPFGRTRTTHQIAPEPLRGSVEARRAPRPSVERPTTVNQPTAEESNVRAVRITVADQTITAQLAENPTAQDLIDQLPLTLAFATSTTRRRSLISRSPRTNPSIQFQSSTRVQCDRSDEYSLATMVKATVGHLWPARHGVQQRRNPGPSQRCCRRISRGLRLL